MTLECPNCGARYNIQDSLIPTQGARVKCKKCGTLITIPAPVVELAPQDLEMIPPPEPAAPPKPPPPPTRAPAPRFEPPAPPVPAPDPSFERAFADEPGPKSRPSPEIGADNPFEQAASSFPLDPGFERAVAPARFGSSPRLTEPSPPPKGPGRLTGLDTSPDMTPTVAAEHRPGRTPGRAPMPRSSAPVETLKTDSASPAPQGKPDPSTADEDQSKHEKARRLARVLASDIAIYNREKRERGIREGNLVAVLGYEIKKSWEIYKERVGADFANATPYFRDALNEMLAEGKKIF
jgi:predicted Zn finger-like uncharacterized protein